MISNEMKVVVKFRCGNDEKAGIGQERRGNVKVVRR